MGGKVPRTTLPRMKVTKRQARHIMTGLADHSSGARCPLCHSIGNPLYPLSHYVMKSYITCSLSHNIINGKGEYRGCGREEAFRGSNGGIVVLRHCICSDLFLIWLHGGLVFLHDVENTRFLLECARCALAAYVVIIIVRRRVTLWKFEFLHILHLELFLILK